MAEHEGRRDLNKRNRRQTRRWFQVGPWFTPWVKLYVPSQRPLFLWEENEESEIKKINMCYLINWGEEDSIRRGHTMDCWNLTLLCIPVVQRWTVTIRGNDTNYRVEYDKLQHAPWPEVRLCGGTQWLRVTCPAVTRVWVKSILVNNPSVSATIMEVSRRLLNLVQLWFRAENDF